MQQDEYGIDEITGEIGIFRYPSPLPPVRPPDPDVFDVAAPNGVVDVDGAVVPVNGAANSILADIAESAAPVRPKMYNIDLERIHAHLYRGKYLTTQDFLDDLAKIVHNATIFHGDNERLVKAQMMYTTAQVHTNEFDSHFRLECERMAARERKRREEWAAANPKPKHKSGARNDRLNAEAMGIRRSARHNGQQPEMVITDPVQLERRLKRQRSSEPSGESQDEAVDGPRSSKKIRITSEDEDGADPLDVVGPTSSQPRRSIVRFMHSAEAQLPASPSPVARVLSEDRITVDTQPRVDTSTFNLDVVTQTSSARQSHILVLPLKDPASAAAGPSPIISPDTPEPSASIEPARDIFHQSSTESLSPSPPVPQSQLMGTDAQIPPRTPSPSPEPHPTFTVTEHHLQTLSKQLADRTGALNVEQLEQLRAICLGCIWRRRSEWQRDDMVQELLDIVREFVDEVAVGT